MGFDRGVALDQHTIWVARCQQLPPDEMIKSGDAATAVRGLSLALKDRHRQVILRTALMEVDGVIGTFSGRKQKARKHYNRDRILEVTGGRNGLD